MNKEFPMSKAFVFIPYSTLNIRHSEIVDRDAPRMPRPEGRGRGELYKNSPIPHREAPPGRAGRLHFTQRGLGLRGVAVKRAEGQGNPA